VRRSKFAPDPDLPEGFFQVRPNDYRGSGFDRGHMCPSGDRTATKEDNEATFYVTNMVPQEMLLRTSTMVVRQKPLINCERHTILASGSTALSARTPLSNPLPSISLPIPFGKIESQCNKSSACASLSRPWKRRDQKVSVSNRN
jgi:hypothetical protein